MAIRIVNSGCGHNLPTDSRHRALDLVVTFYKKGGLAFPALDGARESGQEPGSYRLRFRDPYRSETDKKNTQIPAGEARVLEAPIPDEAHRVTIQILYKLTPFLTDAEAREAYREEIPLP